ncbi:MAG: Fe-S cluster assembly ATP-binding protein [Patescibacteria group bacterium]|nr:Fe-S cluster assembly ATP-binding protein [Patescibacteria group bacterium]
MLEIKNLSVCAEGKNILSGVNAELPSGSVCYLLGKNGSGKSSLAFTIAGHPKYSVTGGEIFLDGESIITLAPEERAAKGIFLSLQNVPEIRGVKLSEYLRSIVNAKIVRENPSAKPLSPFLARRLLLKESSVLGIPEAFLDRELNVGFSGGEKRRIELLQMKLLHPKLVILDEVDSGLDVDAFRMVADMLASLRSPERTFLVVTHNFALTEILPPDRVFVMEK